MSVKSRILLAHVGLVAVLAASCRNEPQVTCKVNGVCFACPDAKAKANCQRDPSTSRCKWTDPSHCK